MDEILKTGDSGHVKIYTELGRFAGHTASCNQGDDKRKTYWTYVVPMSGESSRPVGCNGAITILPMKRRTKT